ncbi:ABC transporter ATP-binding protein [Kiloniella laminariae]|uniref:ABC transporter ATP-binding protein n=1 Tax=Kiloniella laminariae TaxID=454162 RepID=A0ABT4LEK4_9PROT|nr:ABC transporter ATP-binding protein [Kiloniella laminariae]MCZ4279538.1 ABC transporter ATP-binding protein [Kiloniella laminariae]
MPSSLPEATVFSSSSPREISSISLDNVTLGYSRQPVVEGLSLNLQQGKVNILIGPNGCGKSTLLRAMAGLLKPTQGSAVLQGKELHKWPRRTLARALSFLPQAPEVPENMTIGQLVEQGRFAHRGLIRALTAEDREAVSWALEQTGLLDYRERSMRTVSGGERQRAWIATALAQQASILLLDEPTTYLDLGHQLEVLELLQELSTTQGLTIALSLHEINHALMFADSLTLLANGKLLYSGPPQELVTTGLIESTFAIRGQYLNIPGHGPLHIATSSQRRKNPLPLARTA